MPIYNNNNKKSGKAADAEVSEHGKSEAEIMENVAFDNNEEMSEGSLKGVSKSGKEPTDDIIRDGSHLENGKLKPNIKYQSGEHEYIYETNEDGLIVRASTQNLQLKTHTGRLEHDPNTYDKAEDDHAGHLFGDRFGGSPELDNLVSQARRVNLSEFKVIENIWARELKKEGTVITVDIAISYGETRRPTGFNVMYTINDVLFIKPIIN